MIYLLAGFLVSVPPAALAPSFEKVEKHFALVESERGVVAIRGMKGMLGNFERAVDGVKSDLSKAKPSDAKAVAAKVGSLQRQAELVHRLLQRARQETAQQQWLEVRRGIDEIGVHVGVKPKLPPSDPTSTIEYDTKKLRERVKRFHEALKSSRDRNVQRIRFHANDVAFQLGRLESMAKRGPSKAKEMKSAWKKLWPEMNGMLAHSKRLLPRNYQREAEEIYQATKALEKRFP